jgi:excisionase family DNA binding protein
MVNALQSTPGVSQLQRSSGPIWNSCEAAEYLKIHPRTLTRMARRGEIPSIQIGRLWGFRQSDLDEWLGCKVNFVSYSCRLNS